MTEIRFLHIADLHLDSPFKGISAIPKNRWQNIRESTFEAFTRIIEYAVENKPDFVLIVGDIYDGENRSLRAQHLFQKGMDALQTAGVPVFICYGNHDHLSGSWVRFQLPDNVYVFGENVETKWLEVKGKNVQITGFSYKERHVREAMHVNYPQAGDANEFHIGMLHGSVEGNEEHDVYAPFRKSDLIGKHYDYWALGHIHKRQVIHEEPPIVYPGNTQSRHRNEKGMKGFYDVSLSKEHVDLQFISSSAFIYDELEISCEGIVHANEMIQLIERTLHEFRAVNGSAILALTLTHISLETQEMIQSSSKEEWLAVIQESLEGHDPFIIIQSLNMAFSKEETREYEPIIELLNEWDATEWKTVLKDLYQHPRGSKFLPPIDGDFLEETIVEAEQLLSKMVTRKE
ncbi:DNA repair exonuclease [Psychrobacillus sp.]|uniref:metallophosphoesterase family protein n=1 Tax=Psychrobacillus sp. TaxID=1871623 RepID=UPI0028BD2187|nr:DNA repair exonuclease [Psychrobacillus sp.]